MMIEGSGYIPLTNVDPVDPDPVSQNWVWEKPKSYDWEKAWSSKIIQYSRVGSFTVPNINFSKKIARKRLRTEVLV